MTTVVVGEALVDLVWRAGDTSVAAIAGGSPAVAALLRPAEDGTLHVRLPENRDDVKHLLRRAATAGALACERPGAQPLTRAEPDAALLGGGVR